MDFDLRHLHYVIAIAEERNFSRAAERLHIAQPPLSQQVKQLEERLGFKLFERGKRVTILTPAGECFYQRGKALLQEASTLAEEAKRAALGEIGKIHVAYVAALSNSFISTAFRRLKKACPQVEIELEDMPESNQLEALQKLKIDVGFISLAPSDSHPDLAFRCFQQYQLGLLISRDDPRSKEKSLNLVDFKKDRFIAIDPDVSPQAFALLVNLYSKAGINTSNLLLARNGQTITDYVAAGLGIAIVPSLFQERAGSEVVFKPLRQKLPKVRFHLAWNKNNQSAILANFLKISRTLPLEPR